MEGKTTQITKQRQYLVSGLSEQMFAVESYLQPFGERALSTALVL
jgi:hypothetical protein